LLVSVKLKTIPVAAWLLIELSMIYRFQGSCQTKRGTLALQFGGGAWG